MRTMMLTIAATAMLMLGVAPAYAVDRGDPGYDDSGGTKDRVSDWSLQDETALQALMDQLRRDRQSRDSSDPDYSGSASHRGPGQQN